jgi:unsaturated rhamnogalacturonyl hydrolase
MHRRDFLGATVAAGTLLTLGQPARADSAAAPGRAQIVATLRQVNGYWMRTTPATSGDNDWDWATYHNGNMALFELLGERKYYDYSLAWARKQDWAIRQSPSRPFFADYHIPGEVYLSLYKVDPQPERLTAITRELDALIASDRTNLWTWVDALHMGMPVLQKFGQHLGKPGYLARMHELYLFTKNRAAGSSGGFYNRSTGLWWRDKKYVGTTTYWSRGNGWALAALGKMLTGLPVTDPRRAGYAQVMCEMAAPLRRSQRSDGLWPANLGAPEEYPAPETSGTALFTYGIAAGVNAGVLDAATYRPVAERAWQGMVTHAVHPSGFLGYVQREGQKPSDHQPVTYRDTSMFGVGSFLLAGVEMARLATPS